MTIRDRLFLAAFIFVVCLIGLYAIESSNRWWWFVFVVPASMAAWFFGHHLKKKDSA